MRTVNPFSTPSSVNSFFKQRNDQSLMRLLIVLFWLLAAAASARLRVLSGVALYLRPALPDVDTLRDVKLQTPLRVYSKDHKLIDEFGEMRRLPISFEQIPQGFIDALLAAEDDNFLHHQDRKSTRLNS